jgi:hypothetical protein
MFKETYYHYGYEGVMEAALNIRDDYDVEKVTVYHESELIERNKIRCIYHPYGEVYELRALIKYNASRANPGSVERPDVFIFIEKEPLPPIEDYENDNNYTIIYERRTNAQNRSIGWIHEFNTTHNISIYFEDDDIWVYHYKHGDLKQTDVRS